MELRVTKLMVFDSVSDRNTKLYISTTSNVLKLKRAIYEREGGVYMESLDFLVTAICFTVLGYGLCYITLSSMMKSKTQIGN